MTERRGAVKSTEDIGSKASVLSVYLTEELGDENHICSHGLDDLQHSTATCKHWGLKAPVITT